MNERILKFKAWHKTASRLFDVMAFNNSYVREAARGIMHKREECVLLQFSGLIDSRGADIYEGHIILSEYADRTEPSGIAKVYNLVAFQEGSFGIMSEHDITKFCSVAEVGDLHDAIVVGNIFEHADLLKRNDEEEDEEDQTGDEDDDHSWL